jgi:hypothetical protein
MDLKFFSFIKFSRNTKLHGMPGLRKLETGSGETMAAAAAAAAAAYQSNFHVDLRRVMN